MRANPERIAEIQRRNAAGDSDQRIANALGIPRQQVHRLRVAYRIPTAHPKHHPAPKPLTLPPIDPEKAQRITNSKRAYWRSPSSRPRRDAA